MSADSFFDTNVLVYAFDRGEPRKQALAAALVQEAGKAGTAVLSTQVLQEFFVTVTRKLAVPMEVSDARAAVADFAQLRVVEIDVPLILEAIDRASTLRISFWDALIVTAALAAGCRTLYTEDLSDNTVLEGLRFANPFKSAALPVGTKSRPRK
ncbi:MAG: PIN domain-containing protein [Candidatus Riflebacteria bacterium]|nr:PIN domain-containing protein [Candidatus Riflebacteria bacterium]